METADRRRFSFHEFVDPERGRLAATLTHNMYVKPGEKGFFRWYVISSPLPIIAASIGPLSNLNSVVALVEDWRTVPLDSTAAPPRDAAWFIVLNAISLFISCMANISLLLNFSRRINYNFSQVISIGGWYIASFILLALIITSQYVYFDGQDTYIRSQGYWHAVIACVLYFVSSTLLLINEFGHLLGNYHAAFNLTSKQRSIMIQNVLLMVWIGGGGAVFGDLLGISYADGIYFCVVTILTIGLGDLVAHNTLGRALCLPYAFIGVIMLGLIVATIRQIVLEAGGQTIKFHRAEKRRHNKLKQAGDMIRDGIQIDPEMELELEEKAFQEMRDVHEHAIRSHRRINAILSVFIFVLFLLFGAMVFSFTESDWTYFDGVYFCALCLLTIGYGDFTPKSYSGRPLFVVWALFAVPLMTILVSNLGDTLFKELLEGGRSFANWALGAPKSARDSRDIVSRSSTIDQDDDDDTKTGSASSKSSPKRRIIGQQPPSEDQRIILRNTRDQCHVDSKHGEGVHPLRTFGSVLDDLFGSTNPEHQAQLERTIQICDHIRQVLHHQLEDPTHAFSYDEWREMLEITGSYNRNCSHSVDDNLSDLIAPLDVATLSAGQKKALYWLGDRSPLRYPIVETDFFLVKYFDALERQIINLMTALAGLQSRDMPGPSAIRSATATPTMATASTTSVATAPARANTTGFTRNVNDSTASVMTGSNNSTCTRYESPMPYPPN